MNRILPRKLSAAAVLILALLMSMLSVAQPAYASPRSFANPTTTVFINEIHYDNSGTDSGEAVEIAGPAGTDLTGWDIVLYNGSGGAVYDTDALSGVIPNQQGGYGTVVLTYPSNGIQNGAPDGIALVDASDTVVQFLSYEGSFTAVGGPADGLTSTDIGVSESGSGAAGNSLQLTGSGSTYGNFTWATEAANTFGAPNTGQTFVVSGPTNPTGSGSATPSTAAPGDPTLLTVTVTPGTNPASTGLAVSCDLSSIGGSATQAFFDDATNGDATAGDNIFSFTATVDSGTSEGAKSLDCTISDAEARTGNASIALTVQEPVSIIINEILADPDATNGDANGDGTVNTTQDEFVEIVNNEPTDLDISGWTLSDGVSARHIFPANTVVPASCSIVVFAAGTPTGTFGRSLVQVSSTGQLGLNNSGDTVTLNNGLSDVASYIYGSEGGDNQSLTRDPDVTGADPLVKHSTAAGSGGALFSPGTKVDGSQFSGCPAELKIHDVQGNGAASSLVGQTVIVSGVVVGDFQDGASGTNGDFNGFHIQEEDADADADPLTSEGIFVYDGSSPAVNVAIGDLVQVEGVVSEFNGLTEITSFTGVTVLSSGNPLPTPATVSLPVNAVTDFEAYEGMRVTFPQALVISEYFNFDRYGEIVLTSTRHLTPTAEFEPGSPQVTQAVQDFLLDKITLDDGRSTQNPDPALHPDGGVFDLNNLFRGGDTLTDVTGVVDFANGVYKIQPTQGATYVNANPRTASPDPVGGRLRVASMNTLNFFLTLDTTNSDSGPGPCGGNANLDCRGADASQPLEFTRQRDKLLAALTGLDADIIGLNELENTPGVDPLGDPTNGIVAGLNATFGPGTYSYINTGVIGLDAIRVGLVYKTASVVPVGSFEILDSTDDPLFLDTKSRPSLAQTFEEISTGARFTVVVNHFKSKGSACDDVGDPDLGDGQGNCSQTRKNAAIALVNWLATDPTNSGDPDFLIMGDLNSYDKEESIDTILAGGFTDLAYQFHGEGAYSYVFDGQTGYLDYALASNSLLSQVTGMTDWHINADEPDLIDYDTSFKQPAQDAIYAPDAYRSSDHDPVIVGLNLTVPDTLAPDTSIDSAPSNPDNSSSASFAFSGADDISAPGDLTFECDLDGSGFTACTSPQNYNGLSDGSHTFQVRAIDGAGNVDQTPASFAWTIDTAAPTVTLDQASGQSDPTSVSPIHFTAEFSESVNGFDAADVSLSGTAGAATIVVSGGPSVYDVAVSGMTGSGTVMVNIPANAAMDAAGNPNSASINADNSVTFVMIAPAPSCNGHTATIYVNAQGKIVGGAQDGRSYYGTLIGTSGDDVIVGTNRADAVFAFGGDDIICSLNGNDRLFGGNGNDWIDAGAGVDFLDGGFGADTLFGGGNNDLVFGGPGNDSLNGGSGVDSCNGGAGSDSSSACEIRFSIP